MRLVVCSYPFSSWWHWTCCHSNLSESWSRSTYPGPACYSSARELFADHELVATIQIFATVGNEEKVDYLVKTFDMPEHHIFHSRDESFASALKRETGGRGVDIVLNSVSGELLHAW